MTMDFLKQERMQKMSIESIDKSLKKLTEEIERSYNTFNIAINLTNDEGKKDKNIMNHAFALKKNN